MYNVMYMNGMYVYSEIYILGEPTLEALLNELLFKVYVSKLIINLKVSGFTPV